MKLPEGVEWTIHSVLLLAGLPEDRPLPVARIAEFHGVPAAYLAKHLQALSRSGILEAVQGPRGGYRLARPATDITVLEVVEAVDGPDPAFRCTEIRQRGPVAAPPEEYVKPCGIHRLMLRADRAWRAELQGVTIADLVEGVLQDIPPTSAGKFVPWYQEVTR